MALYTPLDFPGLVAWNDGLDAATMFDATSGGSLPAIGAAVARWEDKSGNAHHATQATAGARPLRQTGYLAFDGTADFLSADSIASTFHGDDTPFTFYVVAEPNLTAASGVVASFGSSAGGNNRGELRYSLSGSPLYAFRRDTVTADRFSTGTFSNNTTQIATKIFRGTEVEFFINGTTIGGGALNTGTLGTNPNRFAIGARAYISTDIFFRSEEAHV